MIAHMSRLAVVAALLSCFTGAAEPPPLAPPVAPAQAPPPPAPASQPAEAPKAPLDPVRARAAQIREAATLLDKAADARDQDQKSYAEQLFSSAELIVGTAAVAPIAGLFRQGAPPRVDTPLKQMPLDTPPQTAKAVGSSEQDRPEPPKPTKGTLTGNLRIGGQPFSGDYGVVTLQPVGKSVRSLPTARIMEQRNRTMAPHVLVVPVGSVVSFPNFDPVFHNVFSVSETKGFDLGLYKNGESREVTFDKEGVVRVACNLHANMSGVIVVVSAPHYVVTDASGAFRFGSLAPGKYTLKAFSERSLAPVVREIDIKPGPNKVAIDVTADAPTGPSPDKFGVPRVAKKP
jgi:plastocyanin